MRIRRAVTQDQLEGVARAALGAGHRLVGVPRLRGGSKKGVYRLTLGDDSTAVAYIWHDAVNYWPDAQAGGTGNDSAGPYADPVLGDFPDRDAMMGIAEHNLREALTFLPADDR